MKRPTVSIVVPVYNGAEHLHECLSSIANQSFSDWEAVIVNNCSTDASGSIADDFARADPRFKVMHCSEFLPQAANYNRALASANPEARFIKMVEADNRLWPECLERMLEVAAADERIGIVGCYYVMGRALHGAGVPASVRVIEGRDVARVHLSEPVYFLGCPTTLLFSAEALKNVQEPFPPNLFFDDVDLCFRLLREWKFGFVHQVLAFVRHDNAGSMSTFWNLDFVPLQRYLLLRKYGRDFFSAEELGPLNRQVERSYYRFLGRAVVTCRNRKYWDFHRKAFRAVNERIQLRKVVVPSILELADIVLNPKQSLERVLRRLRRVLRPPKAGVAYTFD